MISVSQTSTTTMKRYPQNKNITTPSVNNDAKRGLSSGDFSFSGSILYADLTQPHVLTTLATEQRDRFLDICFNEWENWLNDYEFRRSQQDWIKPYQPTLWADLN